MLDKNPNSTLSKLSKRITDIQNELQEKSKNIE